MTKNLKLTLAVAILAGFMLSALSTNAYPPFVRKAEKFGAKDCLFCHKEPNGGEGWNDRGNWLIAEKDRRMADAIDLEWLAEYKEGGDKTKAAGDKKEGAEAEKKTDETKPAEPPADAKESKDAKDTKDTKDTKESKESKESKDKPAKPKKPAADGI